MVPIEIYRRSVEEFGRRPDAVIECAGPVGQQLGDRGDGGLDRPLPLRRHALVRVSLGAGFAGPRRGSFGRGYRLGMRVDPTPRLRRGGAVQPRGLAQPLRVSVRQEPRGDVDEAGAVRVSGDGLGG